MKPYRLCLTLLLVLTAYMPAYALPFRLFTHKACDLQGTNRRLKGHVLDFTYNHGTDRRLWSPALGEKRDVYVYVPPAYDPHRQYPLVVYLHGFGQDEKSFLQVVDQLDAAMVCGKLPPAIFVAPDGSLSGKPSLFNAGSFYVNSRAGRFEDFVMQDVWNFVHEQFPIRPERGAHVMMGGSMGGCSAYNLSFKYRDRIGVIVGFLPPLNLRYMDCHGRYFSNFDPNCFGWREQLHPRAPIAKYFGGLVRIRERRLTDPLYGRTPDALANIARENPAEMLDMYAIKPGEFEMFAGYGGRDEFNITAQVESFLFLACCRNIEITSVYLPNGHHTMETGKRILPYLFAWLGPRLTPYGPK